MLGLFIPKPPKPHAARACRDRGHAWAEHRGDDQSSGPRQNMLILAGMTVATAAAAFVAHRVRALRLRCPQCGHRAGIALTGEVLSPVQYCVVCRSQWRVSWREVVRVGSARTPMERA